MIPLSEPTGNRVLDALPAYERNMLTPYLTHHNVSSGDIIQPAGAAIEYVYFPTSCVFSILMFMQDGAGIEVTTTGREGLTSSLQVLLGAERARYQTVCQVMGETKRIEVQAFKNQLATLADLRRLTERYALSTTALMGQSVGCNRLHTLTERCARWLLITHDRVADNHLLLTQEFLATMLGVHRPAVSLAAATLQQAGFITYRRGHITILDRAGLESASCECYEAASGHLNGSSFPHQ